MESYSLLTTLGTGVFASFTLFFLFYLGLKWNNKLAALVTILIVMGIYIPLAATHWAGVDVFAIHFAFFVMSGYGLGIITSHRSNRQRLDTQLGQATEQSKKAWFHWAPAIIVIFFIIYGGGLVKPANWVPFAPSGFVGIMGGAAIVFFSFIGFFHWYITKTISKVRINPSI